MCKVLSGCQLGREQCQFLWLLATWGLCDVGCLLEKYFIPNRFYQGTFHILSGLVRCLWPVLQFLKASAGKGQVSLNGSTYLWNRSALTCSPPLMIFYLCFRVFTCIPVFQSVTSLPAFQSVYLSTCVSEWIVTSTRSISPCPPRSTPPSP